ncbi:serine hydrolase-like protein [Anthonomus grandis grandis]|uniref:serine hydrolase-like protein n=1 Tax=Anthonomus grandis grandis TaxID=2921223 RepID=UPI002166838E|nr:serine hydrolase-like protein [Anthonomus grandis grandis]XP_050303536.1 serine hydrolase-like protein [Anthonomus grandis grandis]
METREIKIDAPWGKIALKLWGDERDPAVFAIHGVMDNAGSFDNLIPLLPTHMFYICVDLPGHGKSDHFPPHLPIFTINYVLTYIIVTDYFKTGKYIVMGHSYGGQIGQLFSRIYPERVEKLIMFDTIYTNPIPTKYYREYLEDKFSTYLYLENKMKTGEAPLYSYQEAVDKIMKVRPYPIEGDAVKNLLKRMLIPVEGDKYKLSIDQRLKCFINPLHNDKYAIDSLTESPLKCPVLMIFGLDSRAQRHLLRPILSHLKKQKNVTVKYVPGHHDVHQNDPERVAPIVNEFLAVTKSKL